MIRPGVSFRWNVTAMLGLACILIATGISAYRSGALPRWLAIVSIVLGAMAPLGPGGFAPFLNFPYGSSSWHSWPRHEQLK